MDSSLKPVAEAGDINSLYTLLEVNPFLLDNLDNIPFVETPLHLAASLGHTQFAAEIMRLKPSFADKPNPQGHTPLQVALQNSRTDTVRQLIAIYPELTRVKGREGMTPLHFAAENGDIELLNRFLLACPDSITETTVRNETALHIAVKNRRSDAFQVLIGRLGRTVHKGSFDRERKILNMKDIDGNTVLHIAVQTNQPQVVQVVLDSRVEIKINEMNMEGQTALDISLQFPAQSEMKKMLQRAGGLVGTSIADPNRRINFKMLFFRRKLIGMIRLKRDMSDTFLNVTLVVMILIATGAYQSALSPPGGVWQGNGTEKSNNIGKSVMDSSAFLKFCFVNSLTLSLAVQTIFLLLPINLVSVILFIPFGVFVICFMYSMSIISPSPSLDLAFIIVILAGPIIMSPATLLKVFEEEDEDYF